MNVWLFEGYQTWQKARGATRDYLFNADFTGKGPALVVFSFKSTTKNGTLENFKHCWSLTEFLGDKKQCKSAELSNVSKLNHDLLIGEYTLKFADGPDKSGELKAPYCPQEDIVAEMRAKCSDEHVPKRLVRFCKALKSPEGQRTWPATEK